MIQGHRTVEPILQIEWSCKIPSIFAFAVNRDNQNPLETSQYSQEPFHNSESYAYQIQFYTAGKSKIIGSLGLQVRPVSLLFSKDLSLGHN